MQGVQYEISELVGTTNSEIFGVNPDHGKLMEQHFKIYEGIHANFTCYKKHRSGNKYRYVYYQE